MDNGVGSARVEVLQRVPLLSKDPNAVLPQEPLGEPVQECAVREVFVHEAA